MSKILQTWLHPWAAQRRSGCRRWRPWSWWDWCASFSPCAWMSAPCWARRGSRRMTSTTYPCGCPAGSPSAPWTGPATARWPPVRHALVRPTHTYCMWWGDAPPCCFWKVLKQLGAVVSGMFHPWDGRIWGADRHPHSYSNESQTHRAEGVTKDPCRQCTAEPICSVGENYKTSPRRALNVNYFIISYCLVNLNCRTFLHEIR